MFNCCLLFNIYFFQYFEGNNDRNSEVKHVVYGVLTRFLQFLPKAHQGGVCMRTEVFGVRSKPGNFKHCYFLINHFILCRIPDQTTTTCTGTQSSDVKNLIILLFIQNISRALKTQK